ncbi:hypothetical protein ACFU7Y_23320 [Kitasatospora sp. NPDC057542]|nr:hypothetical protein [Streptomyces sp. LS1784]
MEIATQEATVTIQTLSVNGKRMSRTLFNQSSLKPLSTVQIL